MLLNRVTNQTCENKYESVMIHGSCAPYKSVWFRLDHLQFDVFFAWNLETHEW